MTVEMREPREPTQRRHLYSKDDMVTWVESHDGETYECVGPVLWAGESHVGLESPVDGAALSVHYKNVAAADVGGRVRPSETVRGRLSETFGGVRSRRRRETPRRR